MDSMLSVAMVDVAAAVSLCKQWQGVNSEQAKAALRAHSFHNFKGALMAALFALAIIRGRGVHT